MPIELLQCLTLEEAKAYWRGPKEALWVLSRLEGISFRSRDMRELHRDIDFNSKYGEPTLASTIVSYFRNHSTRAFCEISEQVSKEIIDLEENGFSRPPGNWIVGEWRPKRKS